MELIIKETAESASKAAARLVARLVKEKPNAVLGLATGSTPLMLYRELIRIHREEDLDFSGVTTFNLDEYLGLPKAHEHSYCFFMQKNLFSQINIPSENSYIPDGMTENVPAACADYENAIRKAGGIDLQVLGIGTDGHVGFNEPSSSFASRTRIKTLTPQTLEDNARFFDGDESKVPHHCITMGIGTIMDARCALMLAFGAAKAEAISAMAEGPVTASVPASILQHHPRAKIFIDEPAAARLKKSAYYRWVYAGKPDWQKDA